MIVCGFEKFNPFHKKGWPYGYGFRGSCAKCPRRNDCSEGKDCKIFAPAPKAPRPEIKTGHANASRLSNFVYGLAALLCAGAIICFSIYTEKFKRK